MPDSKPTSSKLAASIEKVKAVQPTRQRTSKKALANAKPKASTQAKVTRRATAQNRTSSQPVQCVAREYGLINLHS